MTPHAEILFPVAAELEGTSLSSVPVARLRGDGPLIEERYEVDDAGVVSVTISDLTSARASRFVL